jgi:hypothetical protein
MSVPLPILEINPMPLPQYSLRSRREVSTRDTINARNIESWRSSPPVLQSFFRPSPSLPTYSARKDAAFYDQIGVSSRGQPPLTVPAPPFNPNGSKLEGNEYFDQYAPSFDPRNVARELKSVVKEAKDDKGTLESKRILSRNFVSRYVPEGFAEESQLNSLKAFETLRPKIDDPTQIYRQYS